MSRHFINKNKIKLQQNTQLQTIHHIDPIISFECFELRRPSKNFKNEICISSAWLGLSFGSEGPPIPSSSSSFIGSAPTITHARHASSDPELVSASEMVGSEAWRDPAKVASDGDCGSNDNYLEARAVSWLCRGRRCRLEGEVVLDLVGGGIGRRR